MIIYASIRILAMMASSCFVIETFYCCTTDGKESFGFLKISTKCDELNSETSMMIKKLLFPLLGFRER